MKRALRRLKSAAQTIALGATLATTATGAAQAAPAPVGADEPVEGALFDSWIGKYQDLGIDGLFAKLGLAPSVVDGALSFAPSKAKFYDTVTKKLGLSPAAKARLEKEGLVMVPQGPRAYSMAAAYYELYTKDLPLLVTTDSILDAMHRSFDDILADMEETVLKKALEKSLRAVHSALPALAKANPQLAEAIHDVDLYLTVALNLLESDPGHSRLLTAPRVVPEAEVFALLKKVDGLQLENPGFGTGDTEIYGARRGVDWSQFKPRGHYTKTESLQRYFRAMMWLGRADTGFDLSQVRQARAAALLSQQLDATGGNGTMQPLRDVVDLMVGQSDDLAPTELQALLQASKLTTPASLVSDKVVKKLVDDLAASGLGEQRIRSQLVVSPPETADKVPPPPVFQLFGQRFILDSFVLGKVVYDDIVFKGEKQERRMPSGLDVMAAFGNELATRLLAVPGGELVHWHYAANLAALTDVIAAWSPAHWRDNLYDQWLDALRSLNHLPAGKVPEVMKRDVWDVKTLQTQLASWAQLRHDTILYAKQSYTASVGCLYPRGFVEPYPAFYAKLQTFATTAAKRLGALGPSFGSAQVDSYVKYFEGFATTMGKLEGMADKELAGKKLSASEDEFLGNTIEQHMTGGGYAPTPDWNGWYIDLIYAGFIGNDTKAVEWKPTIADVHTDPDAGQVLEVGTGNVDFLVAAIDNDGDKAIHVGPSFSYYELLQPAANRLTDEQWTENLASDKAPPRPSWVTPFVAK